jgi:hypothetical protein
MRKRRAGEYQLTFPGDVHISSIKVPYAGVDAGDRVVVEFKRKEASDSRKFGGGRYGTFGTVTYLPSIPR